MNPIVDEVASKLRDSLSKSIDDFEGLYVYGSQVNGNANEDSDIDIVLLFKQRYLFKPDPYYEILSKIRYEYSDVIDLDIVSYTIEDLEINPSYHDEVVNKGVYYGTQSVY